MVTHDQNFPAAHPFQIMPRRIFTPEADIHWDYIRLAMRSVADTCIIPVQDYLGLGCEARINTPSTLGGNWIWRSDADSFTDNLAAKIKKITQLCARSLQQKGE